MERHPRFVTRHGGTLTMIADDKPFPKSAAVVVAELAKDGKVTLKIDGTVVAQGKTPGAMRDMPLDGLEVGEDRNGAVGRYSADTKLQEGGCSEAAVDKVDGEFVMAWVAPLK